MKLADKVGKKKQEILKLYRSGNKTIEVCGVLFNIKRGGPDNNFIMVSPAEKGRLSPILNFVYDEQVEQKRTVYKLARRAMEKMPRRTVNRISKQLYLTPEQARKAGIKGGQAASKRHAR
jgi:hypothetical protein